MGKRSREKKERRFSRSGEEKKYFYQSSLEKTLFSIIQWGTYLALFAPLVFIKYFYFPFVVPKTIFFRIIVDIIFIAYILLVLINRRYLPKINALTISLIVFLGIVILTSLTGVNLAKSFWSTFERMTGILTFFHLFAFYIILTSCFRERRDWERILTVSILAGVLLGLYVLVAKKEISDWGGGTIGNTSFMAAYLSFNIFFALIFFLAKKGGWRIFYGALFLIMFLSLFSSTEIPRGVLGALFPGFLLLFLGYLIFSQNKLLKKLVLPLIVLIILVGLGVLQLDFIQNQLKAIKESGSWRSRAMVWQIGWESWKEKFWFGWGPENFNTPFVKYFDPALPLTVDVWYDRVHNIVLDSGVTSGMLGLVSYLAIFGVAIFKLLKICPQVVERRNIFFPLGMTTLLTVYFAQNLLVFDMVSSYLMFFLSLAFISFLISPPSQEFSPVWAQKKISPSSLFLGALLIIIALFTLYFGNIQPARASYYTVHGIALPPEEAITAFQKALQSSPMAIFETPEQFARRMTGFIFDPKVDRELLEEGLELAAQEMKKSIVQGPEDFRFYLLLGRHYNDFYHFTGDKEKLKQAEELLEKAILLSPRNQQGYWALAQTRLSQGRAEESFALLQKAIDLEPRFPPSHWYLAMAYRITGKNELALEKIKEAERLGYNWKANLEDLKRAIEIYQNLKDFENLVPLYQLAIELDPQNAQFRAALSVAYANLGQFEKARESAKEALKLNPDFAPQIEEFLKSLPQ